MVDAFTKQLAGAELNEYRAVCQREAEAANASGAQPESALAKKPMKVQKEITVSDTLKKVSALDAAAKVLGESEEPMATKAMIEAMPTKLYWTSPSGKTPHATLYAAIVREINLKGTESRFVKVDKGHFALSGK